MQFFLYKDRAGLSAPALMKCQVCICTCMFNNTNTNLTPSMGIQHIQALMNSPGITVQYSAHFSDNMLYVVALYQNLVTNCTFSQCDAFTFCFSNTHPSNNGFQSTLVPEAEQTVSPQYKQVQKLQMKSSNETVKDRTSVQCNLSMSLKQTRMHLLAFIQ